MSTKTLKKRIALVATAALGFGLISVVPAFAATYTATLVTVGAQTLTGSGSGTASISVNTGTALSFTVLGTGSSTPTAADTFTITPTITSKPTKSGRTVSNLGPVVGALVNTTNTATGATGVSAFVVATTAAATGATTYTFTPDAAGTYVITYVTTSSATAGASAVLTVTAVGLVGTPTLPVFLSTASLWDGTTTFAAAYTAGTTGVGRTKGLITDSMTAFTVPLNTATTLIVAASASTFGTGDIFDLSLNGVIVQSDTSAPAAITESLTAYTFAKVGTYTGNIRYYQTATTRLAATATFDIPFTVTVGALDAFSPPLSTFLMGQTSVGSTATDVLATYGSGAVSTLPVGMLSVALKNVKGTQSGGALTATSEVSITGPGFIKYDATNAYSATGCTAAALRSANNSGADVAHGYFICGDGTSGVATINIRVQDEDGLWTVLASKSVTMHGKVTTLTSTATYTVGKAGGGTVGVNTAARTASTVIPAVIVRAVDKNGVGVGGLTIKLVSSDVTVANTDSSGACNADTPDDAVGTNAYSSGGVGYYNCALVTPSSATAGKTATLTWRVLDPADTVNGTAYLTTTTAVTIGGAIKTSTLSFDKATYGPGDAIVYSVVTKDAAGGTPYDGQAAFGATATANKSFGGTMPGASKLIKNGAYTSSATAPTLFAPVSIGAVTMTALDGTGAAYMSATATVVDAAATAAAAEAAAGSSAAADAAAEATDAANAATDAANAAAEAADAATAAAQDASDAVAALSEQFSTLVASIKAQITSLTALIVKIQKKMKA